MSVQAHPIEAAGLGATGAPRRPLHPQLWAVLAAIVSPPLFWLLASTLSPHSTPPLPPAAAVVPLTAVVAALGAVVVVAVRMRRWRLAVSIATALALPLTLAGLAALVLFGLGLVLLAPVAPWWAVIVSSARQLARDEHASGGPSARQRARRARAWSLAVVAATVVATVLSAAATRGWSTTSFPLVVIAAQAAGAVLSIVLLVLVVTGRWRSARSSIVALVVAIVVAAFLGSILGLLWLVLLVVPVLLVSAHLDALLSASSEAVS